MIDGRVYYSGFMLLALAVFLTARRWTPGNAGINHLPWQQRALLALAAFIGGAFASKIPFLLSAPEGPLAAFLVDGKTVMTGLIGAYVSVELTKLALGIHAKTGDGYALPLALALAVGRFGCFFYGCCYGTECELPWAVVGGDPPRPRHPTQIYEVLFHASMALILWLTRDWEVLRYQRLKFYLIAYGIYRFATEYIRPEPTWALGMTFYQWTALVMIVGLSVQWWFNARRKRFEQENELERLNPSLALPLSR